MLYQREGSHERRFSSNIRQRIWGAKLIGLPLGAEMFCPSSLFPGKSLLPHITDDFDSGQASLFYTK